MFKKILWIISFVMMMMPSISYAETNAMKISSSNEFSFRRGLRFGYTYANNADNSERLASPHMFSMGFEMQQTMAGGEWLDLLFIQNVIFSGLEQSVVIPSANMLVGFEINKSLQLGVGANVSIYDSSGHNNYIHLVSAIGWTQNAGVFSVPVHIVFVPDINGHYRLAVTTGVNW